VSRVSRVTPQITSSVNPFDWFPEEGYWSGLDKALSSTREDYRGALRHINGDSPFTQPPLKFVEVRLQVANKQRLLAGHGYDGRVARVEGQLDVVRGWRHVDTQTEEDRGDQSPLSNPSLHASISSRHLNKRIHSTCHAYQICQLTNDWAGRTARSLYKKGHVSSLRSFNAYIKKKMHQYGLLSSNTKKD